MFPFRLVALHDSGPSIPGPFTPGAWGSPAAMDTAHSHTKRPCRVGGEGGAPSSPHFTDEALRYSTDDLRGVYFHPEDLVGHTERASHHGT